MNWLRTVDTVMVNDDCQLDWTLDVLRDTPLAGSSLKETHRERKNMHRKTFPQDYLWNC